MNMTVAIHNTTDLDLWQITPTCYSREPESNMFKKSKCMAHD